MSTSIELFISAFTIIVLLLIFFINIFRSPLTSTKVTFGVFALFLILWNLAQIVINLFPENLIYQEQIHSIFSNITLYSLVVFGLHFPFYRRREVKLTIYASFIGGMGYIGLLQTLCIPLIDTYFPLEKLFFQNINHFLTRSFSIICMLSFAVVIIFKLSNSIVKLKKFLFKALLFMIFLTLSILVYVYSIIPGYTVYSTNLHVIFIDIIFLAAFIHSLYQFRFIDFYPGVLSYFVYGQWPRLVAQKSAPSNIDGSKFLKNELWRLYELENWEKFIQDFWFNIIVDETLDNAVEHGGKRIEDEVTVQVFETDKYLYLYVIDRGKGFDPELVPNPASPERKGFPSGRGIYILKRFFELKWNFLGNEVRVRISKNPEDNPR
ncbi:MAG: ATP-binding protein [Leptospiraceae bacterium]|nr:ATP-binding protein [Leptospiraceae bacterium]MCP5494814.1 ATP-binding protein [Leptospiraceae bacterium]